jgi:hypothetical protein
MLSAKGSGFGVWGLGFGAQSFFLLKAWFGSRNQAFTLRILLRMTERFFPFLRLLSENPKPQSPLLDIRRFYRFLMNVNMTVPAMEEPEFI